MHSGHNGHEVSIRYWQQGIPAVVGRPTLGAWLTYALGAKPKPAGVHGAQRSGRASVDGVLNWSNGFMPPLFQGTVLRAQEPRILNPTHRRI